MASNITTAIVLMFLYLGGVFLLWFKYKTVKPNNNRETKKTLPIFPIFMTTLIGIFSIVFLIAFTRSPYNLPRLNDVNSHYNDMVDVGDGIVVVGRTRLTLRDTSVEPIHSYNNTRAYIVKYDYDGNVIWDDIRYIEGDLRVSSSYSSISVDEKGYLVVEGYYDMRSRLEVTYSPEGEIIDILKTEYDSSFIAHHFSSEKTLTYLDTMLDYDEKVHELKLTLGTDDDIEPITFDLVYQHEIITDYNTWTPRINVIYSDDNKFILGVSVFNMNDALVYNQLFLFDYSLNLLNEIDLSENILHGDIQKHDNQWIMLSRDDVNRLSYIISFNESFEKERVVPITTNLDHFMANTMVIEEDLIYIGGNEYETKTKEGFVEYFSGVINVYELNMTLVDSIEMQKGVGINEMILVDDKIYTVGQFNPLIGLYSRNSSSIRSNVGVFTLVNEQKQNYILAFTLKGN